MVRARASRTRPALCLENLAEREMLKFRARVACIILVYMECEVVGTRCGNGVSTWGSGLRIVGLLIRAPPPAITIGHSTTTRTGQTTMKRNTAFTSRTRELLDGCSICQYLRWTHINAIQCCALLSQAP